MSAEKLAEIIRTADSFEDCEQECSDLCYLAGIGDEWESANGDEFIEVLRKAARILDVEIEV